MSANIFKGITPKIIALNSLILVAVWAGPFFINTPVGTLCCEEKAMPLYSLLSAFLDNPFARVLTGFSFVVLISFMLVNFNTSLFFIPERTILPSIVFALSTGMIASCQTLNPVMPAIVLLILSLRSVMKAYRKEGTAFCFFDASLFIGTGILFYANIIWFGIMILAGVIILRGYKLKELFLSVAGLFVPLIFTAGVYFVFSLDAESIFKNLEYNLLLSDKNFEYSDSIVAALGFWGITVLTGMFTIIAEINKMKVRSGKVFVLLMWWFFISAALWFFSSGVSVEIIYLISIPSAYFISYLLVFSRSRVLRAVFLGGIFVTVTLLQVLQYIR